MQFIRTIVVVALILATSTDGRGEEFHLHSFRRVQLTDVYYSEGANFGDLNRDGVMDIVYGPYWFQGPDYKAKHEIYPAKAQPRQRYANNFFSWVHDFNNDGWSDVFGISDFDDFMIAGITTLLMALVWPLMPFVGAGMLVRRARVRRRKKADAELAERAQADKLLKEEGIL